MVSTLRLDPRRPDQLWRSIDQQFASGTTPPAIWLVSSEDPVLGQQCLDTLRQASERLGYERTTLTPDRSFDWTGLQDSANTGGLFSTGRLLDLRLPTGRPGVTGAKVLLAWAESPPADTILVISLPRLDRTLSAVAWIQACQRQGTTITIGQMGPRELSAWVQGQLAQDRLSLDDEALAWLVERCEGNSAAAHQALLKLRLLPVPTTGRIDLPSLQSLLTDQARFTPFQLGDALVSAPPTRVLRMLRALREEGEALPLIIWSLAQAARRLPADQAAPLLGRLAEADTITKGLRSGDAWQVLEQMMIPRARPHPR